MKTQLDVLDYFKYSSLQALDFKKVLLIDSNPIIAQQLSKMITKLNHLSLGFACNLKKIEQRIAVKQPDYIIINLATQGEFDGYQMAKILKLDYEIPFAILLKDNSISQQKWADELNPDGKIIYSNDDSLLLNQIGNVLV